MLKLNIQTKLFLLLSGLTGLVLLIVLIFVNSASSKKIEEDIYKDFELLQYFFRTQQALRYDRLLESAYLIAENSNFKGSFQTGDIETIYFSVLEFSEFTRSDLIVVTDNRGEVLAWFGDQSKTGEKIVDYNGIEEAIIGNAPLEAPEWPLLWNIDNDIYQVVSVPIYLGFNEIVGTITLGSLMQHYEASELSEGTSFQIAFMSENSLIGSSHDHLEFDHYIEAIDNKEFEIDSLLKNLHIGTPFRTNLRDTEHLAFISPLGEGTEAFYIASILLSEEYDTINYIRNNIILTILISILLIIPVAILLGRFFTAPIIELSNSMLRVKEGELNVHVEPRSNDEIGSLTTSFNDMVIGLKERFALSRYVGSHTLEMIQDNINDEAELGGSFKELAIVFSDIRGSTAKFSTTDPKHFVEVLNKTLGFQSECFKKFGGAIDKYVGDEVIAVFSGENALERAISASIEIQEYFKSNDDLNTFFRGLGIGVNYGSMVLGNMGAKDRMDYTVIGPEVNLCARLCSAADDGQIFLPKKLLKEHNLNDRFSYSEVEALNLKGFSELIQVVSIEYKNA